jgi:hypothetical protein
MKTIRTISLVCAGYFVMQMLVMMSLRLFSRLSESVMPAEVVGDNPVYQLQIAAYSAIASMAPWLLLGALCCGLLAWKTRPLWSSIPAISLAMLAGGIIWMLAFGRAVSAAQAPLLERLRSDAVFGQLPGEVKGFVSFGARLSSYSFSIPAIIPPLLLLLFWFVERAKMNKAAEQF